jgi:hypothetical protein
MQIIKSFVKLLAFILPVSGFAQSTYLNQGSKEYHFVDRLEIKQQKNTDLNFSTTKPYMRKAIVEQAEFIDSTRTDFTSLSGMDELTGSMKASRLTKVDEYNLRSLYMNNSEWATQPLDDSKSKHPILKTFYTTKPNLLEVNVKDFFLAVNPVFEFMAGKETDNNQTLYYNSRGVNIRGLIAKQIGFSSIITENQERGPYYFRDKVTERQALPGVGFYKNFKSQAYDYFDARGYLTFTGAKYVHFQVGYDKNFIGNGYRSLFLSDWGNSYLFAKVTTKVWKFSYQNLFMELVPQFRKRSDSLFSRKYAAMHHLSMNVTKWLNVGLFEGVIFGRKDHFDFQYLNPIIFYRHIEGTIGSPDNAVAGFDFKANIAHRFQLYGQLLLDEFILSKVKNDPTSWVNKFGIQAGVKYVDAFGIKNLDLQVEMNRVRPFTYSHNDTIANYTHYNQPLAHPLGANFNEFIGILHYQPLPKWNIYGRVLYYYKGLDSSGVNYGGDIFRDYTTRTQENGFDVGAGNQVKVFNGYLNVGYEIRQNVFIEAGLQYRKSKLESQATAVSSTMFNAGVRINMFRRTYDF